MPVLPIMDPFIIQSYLIAKVPKSLFSLFHDQSKANEG